MAENNSLSHFKFLHYNQETNIHLLDYSGFISYEEGISRIEKIYEYINKLHPDKSIIKLILDVRKTIWETIETHNALSKIARQKFSHYQIFLAVLNKELDNKISDSERWYTDMDISIQWLAQVPHSN